MKIIATLILLLSPTTIFAWSNGPAGNAQTNIAAECTDPPYATHDYVADHGLMFLPAEERAWLMPHRAMYLLGTEAPDNDDIPSACDTPHSGYDDRRKGHSVEWAADFSDFIVINGRKKDRAAVRAQEEYEKAIAAFEADEFGFAAFYLGAMAHYIGDVSQYGHSVPFEDFHSPYENWAKSRTDSFDDAPFAEFMELDRLVRRTPYTATKRVSKATAGGRGKILHAVAMDASNSDRDEDFLESAGLAINMGANEIADVLHTFYLNVVEAD